MGRKTRMTVLATIAALVLAIAAVGVALAQTGQGQTGGPVHTVTGITVTPAPTTSTGTTTVTTTATTGTGTAVSTTTKLPRGYTDDNSAGNRAAAAADAKHHLASVRLPAGSVRLKHRPSGDHGFLSAGAAGDALEAHGWWIVRLTPQQLIAYVEAHRPAGSHRYMTSSGGNLYTGTSELGVAFEWPLEKYRIGSRTLMITVTTLTDGKTGVLVQAESDWWQLRSITEWMPENAASVQIHVARWHRYAAVNLTLDSAAKAKQAAELVNAMPITGTGPLACVLELPGPQMTVKFLNAGGDEIGQIGFMEWPGKLVDSDWCRPVTFTLGGRQMDPLVGGRFMWTLQKLAGHSLIGTVNR